MTVQRERPEVLYPDSDGKRMADNTLQYEWIVTIKGGLDALFRNDPDVLVAGDLLWYPLRGDNGIRLAPDALVAFGRPKGYRGVRISSGWRRVSRRRWYSKCCRPATRVLRWQASEDGTSVMVWKSTMNTTPTTAGWHAGSGTAGTWSPFPNAGLDQPQIECEVRTSRNRPGPHRPGR